MKLTFSKPDLARLIAATEAAAAHHVPYTGESWGTPEETTPGLNLVGDHGVYFMSNRTDADNCNDPARGGSPDNVVYARECNPATAPDWYDVKHDTFGGDDGVVFFPLDEARAWLTGPLPFVEVSFTPAEVLVEA